SPPLRAWLLPLRVDPRRDQGPLGGCSLPRAEYIVQNFDAYTSALKHGRIVDKCPVVCCPVGMKLSASAKHLGNSSQTAWRRWQRSELPAHQLPSGTVMVAVAPLPQGVRPQNVAVSARVASAETASL